MKKIIPLAWAIIWILSGCSHEKKHDFVTAYYYGTKAKAISGGWVIVEVFRTSAINDSTIGQKSFQMILDQKLYENLVGKTKDNPRQFDIVKTPIKSKYDYDTLFVPFGDITNTFGREPMYLVGEVDSVGKQVMTAVAGRVGIAPARTKWYEVFVTTACGSEKVAAQYHGDMTYTVYTEDIVIGYSERSYAEETHVPDFTQLVPHDYIPVVSVDFDSRKARGEQKTVTVNKELHPVNLFLSTISIISFYYDKFTAIPFTTVDGDTVYCDPRHLSIPKTGEKILVGKYLVKINGDWGHDIWMHVSGNEESEGGSGVSFHF